MSRGRVWLIIAACVSFFVAILHIVIVFIGAPAYIFFGGAPRAVYSGSSLPLIWNLSLAAVNSVFGIYGLSGAGIIPRVPILAIGLLIIGGFYTFRGLNIIPETIQILTAPGSLPIRRLLYSLVPLVTGCAYFIGTVKNWRELQKEDQPPEDKGSRLKI